MLCLQYLLTPGGPIPGECLALNGSKGYVDIKLRNAIVPTALTYEHVPTSIAYDIRSAPQDMSVVSAALTDLNFALYVTSARIVPHLKNCSIIHCTFCDFTNEDEKLPSMLDCSCRLGVSQRRSDLRQLPRARCSASWNGARLWAPQTWEALCMTPPKGL